MTAVVAELAGDRHQILDEWQRGMVMMQCLRIRKALAFALFTSLPVLRCAAQSFTNLDFSQAVTSNRIDISSSGFWADIGRANKVYQDTSVDLFPGWRVINEDTQAEAEVAYQTLDSNPAYGMYEYFSGSAVLVPLVTGYGVELYPPNPTDSTSRLSLAQRGQIPANAKTLQFFGANTVGELRINHQLVALQYNAALFEFFPDSGTTFTADVSAFAGQIVEIRFSAVGSLAVPGAVLEDHAQLGPFSFLVSTGSPPVAISVTNEGAGQVRLSWPTNVSGMVLQSTTNLASSAWSNLGSTGNIAVVPATGPKQFFRLVGAQ